MNGFDLSEFSQMITQLEQLGADTEAVTERVLDAGSEPARQVFVRNVPYDEKSKKDSSEHARNNIKVSKTKTAKKSKNRYRVIGALDRKFEYLYYVENGHPRAPAHPFIEKTYREAQYMAGEPMKQTLVQEIENHLR